MMIGCSTGVITVQVSDHHTDTFNIASSDCGSLLRSMKSLKVGCSFEHSDTGNHHVWNAFRKALIENTVQTDSLIQALLMPSLDPSFQKDVQIFLLQNFEDRGEWNVLDSLKRSFEQRTTALTQVAAAAPDMTKNLSDLPDTLLIEFSSTGVPIVEVMINGSKRRFWLDTGSSEMVVSSDIAKEIGVQMTEGLFDSIPTATTWVPGYPAMIEHLLIGKSGFNSVPCLILDEWYLHKKILLLFTEFKIDGIIGWRVLKEMDVEIDYPESRLVIRSPRTDVKPKNNLLFLERPYLRLNDSEGRPLLMFLDTGAEFSSFSDVFNIQYPDLSSSWILLSYQGVGGSSLRFCKTIHRISMYAGENIVHLNDLPIVPADFAKFVSHDGLLGSDFFRTGKIRLDWTNRTFEYTPSQRCIE